MTNVQSDAMVVSPMRLSQHHRDLLQTLAHNAENLDRSLADLIKGSVIFERSNTINLGLLKLTINAWSMSYRAREAVFSAYDELPAEAAEWVSVSANTSLRRLLNEYGDRLLGYDATRNEMTVELFAIEIADSTIKTVSILVRKNKSSN
jgi:hypothetical protein